MIYIRWKTHLSFMKRILFVVFLHFWFFSCTHRSKDSDIQTIFQINEVQKNVDFFRQVVDSSNQIDKAFLVYFSFEKTDTLISITPKRSDCVGRRSTHFYSYKKRKFYIGNLDRFATIFLTKTPELTELKIKKCVLNKPKSSEQFTDGEVMLFQVKSGKTYVDKGFMW